MAAAAGWAYLIWQQPEVLLAVWDYITSFPHGGGIYMFFGRLTILAAAWAYILIGGGVSIIDGAHKGYLKKYSTVFSVWVKCLKSDKLPAIALVGLAVAYFLALPYTVISFITYLISYVLCYRAPTGITMKKSTDHWPQNEDKGTCPPGHPKLGRGFGPGE